MDHTLLVRVVNGVANSGQEFQPLPIIEALRRRVIDETSPFDQLHRKIRQAGHAVGKLGHTSLEDASDSWVVKSPEYVSLELETPQRRPREHSRVNHLQRNRAFRIGLLGTVDDTHSAGAQPAQNAVGANLPWRVRGAAENVSGLARDLALEGSETAGLLEALVLLEKLRQLTQ